MVMTRSLLSISLASLPAVGQADTVYLVPSGEASTTHCLAPVEEGYVSGFDGRYFEVFTVHVTCKEAAHLQPACQQFVQPREMAPPELRPLLVNPATVLVRNTVPLAQVVGVEFQAHYKPQCKVPPMRFRHSPEPLRQPASLFPIVPADLPVFVDRRSAPKELFTASIWESLSGNKDTVRPGDEVFVKGYKGELVADASAAIAGRYGASANRDFDQFLVLSGRVKSIKPGGAVLKVQHIYETSARGEGATRFVPIDPAPVIQPVSVKNRVSKAGSFAWLGETANFTAIKLRLLSIQAGQRRTIEIESESAGDAPMHMRQLMREHR